MPVSSPIGQFVQTLQTIKAESQAHYHFFNTNEAATRNSLINPILNSLGWATTNINMVRVEVADHGLVADYILYDCGRNPKIIIEAKSLGANLDNAIRQLNTYAVNTHIQNRFLTDGIRWYHFDQLTIVDTQPFKIDLSQQPEFDCAWQLIHRLDAARFWLQQDIVVAQPQRGFIPLDALPIRVTGTKPEAIRFPDGEEKAIHSWAGALREFCIYVMAHKANLPLPLTDFRRRRGELIRLTEPQSGDFYMTTYNGQRVFIYLNYPANKCLANIKYILNQLQPASNIGQAAIRLTNQ